MGFLQVCHLPMFLHQAEDFKTVYYSLLIMSFIYIPTFFTYENVYFDFAYLIYVNN